MPIYQAIILGIIQGITEFLPISSSAHLEIIPQIFGWGMHSIYFDAALHSATLLAVLIYFRKELLGLFKNQELLFKILIATLPAGLVGVLFLDQIETIFRSEITIVVMLVSVGILMLVAEKYTKNVQKYLDYEGLSLKKVLIIGFAQALALLRGTSRSGVMISTGMFLKLSRAEAAKFAFLVSVPIMTAVTLQSFANLSNAGALFKPDVIVGFLTAFIVGLLAIKFLLGFLAKHTLIPFVIYRFVLAGIILITIVL